MYPDQPWAGPVGSFRGPVPAPTTDPGDAPNRSFTINCSWLPFLRGALQQLLLQATWDVPDAAALLLVQQRAWTLISMFDECASLYTPFVCARDVTVLASPFGLWTLGCAGTYLFGLGYQDTASTHGVGCSPVNYQAIEIDVVLDTPVFIDNLAIEYNMLKGQIDDPSDVSGVHVYDLVNSANIGTPVTMGSLVDGIAQVYNTSVHPVATDHFQIIIACSRSSSGLPVPPGACALNAVRLDGHAVAYDCG